MLLDALGQVMKHLTDREDARRKFKTMDKNRDGTLDGRELRLALSKTGLQLSQQQCALLVASMDKDGNGVVTGEEFVDRVWQHKLKTVRSQLRAASYVIGGQDWCALAHPTPPLTRLSPTCATDCDRSLVV